MMSFKLLRTTFLVVLWCAASFAHAEPVKLIAFGDSLTAGLGLARNEGFVPQLQHRLRRDGFEVEIVNAGVSGDTTSSGRSRLGWSIGADADGVILELGANDMLRGLPVDVAQDNLDAILAELDHRDMPVLLAGMQAAPNLGADYRDRFNAIYPALAKKYDVVFYPFFLDGVAGDLTLNQADGIHPSKQGVEIIVDRILPSVKQLIEKIMAS